MSVPRTRWALTIRVEIDIAPNSDTLHEDEEQEAFDLSTPEGRAYAAQTLRARQQSAGKSP
jgi:hypothetical protein